MRNFSKFLICRARSHLTQKIRNERIMIAISISSPAWCHPIKLLSKGSQRIVGWFLGENQIKSFIVTFMKTIRFIYWILIEQCFVSQFSWHLSWFANSLKHVRDSNNSITCVDEQLCTRNVQVCLLYKNSLKGRNEKVLVNLSDIWCCEVSFRLRVVIENLVKSRWTSVFRQTLVN